MKKLAVLMICLFAASCSAAPADEVQTVTTTDVTVLTEEELITTAVTTEAAHPDKPQPLHRTKKNSYYENDDISMTFGIKGLRSSLYYPDIVHDIGAYPDMFVLECELNIKNISYEDKTIDLSDISLVTEGNAVIWGAESVSIPSGHSWGKTIIFLCTVAQADRITGIEYKGEAFDSAEKLLPDSVRDTIAIQSEDDVRDHLYRRYVLYDDDTSNDKKTILSKPTVFDYSVSYADEIAGYTTGWDGQKQHLVIAFDAYNRSDYAQLIRPESFRVKLKSFDDHGNVTDSAELAPIAVSADSKLMYEPLESNYSFSRKKTYEVPEFICQEHKSNKTSFILVYEMPFFSPEPHHTKYELYYDAQGDNAPYWASISENDDMSQEPSVPEILAGAPLMIQPDNDGIGYSSDILDISIEFLSAEDDSKYVSDVKISRTYLNARVKLNNKSSDDIVFYPHKLAVRSENNAVGDMRPEDDTVLNLPAGETVTTDISFFGRLDMDAGVESILYLEFDKNAQIKGFEITGRTKINDAIRKILPE